MRKIILICLIAVMFAGVCMAGACFASGSVAYGNRNEDIAQMQKRLKELGYFTEDCTGYYGDVTKTAVGNFQKANNLSVTGVADPATIQAMLSDKAITKQQYIELTVNGSAVEMVLKPGDSGKWVKKLQERLAALGYFQESATGNYGDVTQYAVCFFQLVNSLEVTGIADSATLTKLSAPSAIPVGEYEKSLVLKYGDSGSDVRILQLYLQSLGYFTGDCSAKFGKHTQEAVLSYQKYNGLEQSGECDVAMRLMLIMGESISKEQADLAESTRPLAPGEVSESVKTLKTQLTALGFYTGSIDDEYTAVLSEAVHAFQRANSLSATGKADAETRALINSGSCVSMAAYVERLSTCELRAGASGQAVVLLQTRLGELGYYKGAISGNYDKATESAVVFFQRGHQLSETGVADTATRAVMNASDALSYAEAEAQYFARKQQKEREDKLKTLCDAALKCVSKVYGAGKAGPDQYGNAGLVYYCFAQIGVELAPTVALQLEAARANGAWNEDMRLVTAGQQVFIALGEQVITGIYVGDSIFVYASPDHEMIIAKENIMSSGNYAFIGSISYF